MMKRFIVCCVLLVGSFTNAFVSMAHASEDPLLVVERGAFEDLKRRVGGSTLSSSLFKDTRGLESLGGAHWIGKSPLIVGDDGVIDKAKSESLVLREKIASVIYAHFGARVPETVLSPQFTPNTGLPEYEGKEVMHIMSRFIKGYHDYRDQVGFESFKSSLNAKERLSHREGCTKCINPHGDCVIEGLGRIAAIATWLHDVNFIGGSARNVGYQIIRRGAQIIAKAIIVDPGESFTDPGEVPYPGSRRIQVATGGGDERFIGRIRKFHVL